MWYRFFVEVVAQANSFELVVNAMVQQENTVVHCMIVGDRWHMSLCVYNLAHQRPTNIIKPPQQSRSGHSKCFDQEGLRLRLVGLDPRALTGEALLVSLDGILLLQGEADVIEAVEKAVLAERVNLEVDLGATSAGDSLSLKVNLEVLDVLSGLHEGVNILLGKNDGEDTVLKAVVEEDITEGGGDDAAEAHVEKTPGSVLTGRSAAKVVSGHKDL